MLLTVNGKISDLVDGASALDPRFLLGDGVFDTLRIYSGNPFKLDEHIHRLTDACDRTGIKLSADVEAIARREVERARSTGLADAFMRMTVSRALGLGLGADPSESTLVTLIEQLPALDPRWYSDGISVVVAQERRNEFSMTTGVKTTAYLQSILAFRTALRSGVDDALFLDTEGHLSEATASNIFLVRDGVLHTPPLGCGALPGITRACVLEIARAKGFVVSTEQPLYLQDVETADEIFLTSSVREVVPVISFNESRVGGEMPGPVTRRIMNAYSEMTR